MTVRPESRPVCEALDLQDRARLCPFNSRSSGTRVLPAPEPIGEQPEDPVAQTGIESDRQGELPRESQDPAQAVRPRLLAKDRKRSRCR